MPDQEKASAQWKHVADESSRLAATGADPGGEEGQALAKFKAELLNAFTQGDPEIAAGLKQFWANHDALPVAEQPLAEWSLVRAPGAEFIEKAMAIYQQNQIAGASNA